MLIRLAVMLLDSPYQTQDVHTMLDFVRAALDRGHEVVGIFLYTDGVYNLNSKIQAPGERNLAEELNELARDVRVVGCGTCARFRGVAKGDVIEHGRLGGLGALSGFLDEGDRLVTFGG